MQVDLLRVLESKNFSRLGGNDEISVDFRLICATNKNLEKYIEEEKFREDLYYRINVFSIFIPPLRERRKDILPLAHYFINKYARSMGKPKKKISGNAEEILMTYYWPGNVRELENAIERAMVVGQKPEVLVEDLPLQRKSPNNIVSNHVKLEDIEKSHIEKVLRESDGNITRAAKLLGIDRVTLYNKLKKYKITRQ
jgi:transcriptional regulator with PAS, ATPase and Fis domain